MAGPPYVTKLTKVAWGPADGTPKYYKVFDFDFAPLEADVYDNSVQTPLTGRDKPRVGAVFPKMSFSMHMVGSGTAGTAPPDADLLKACGFEETTVAGTSVTYEVTGNLNLSDDTNAGDVTAADVYEYLGNGFKQGLEEAVANASFEFVAGEPAKATYNITGQYVAPTEASSSESEHTAATPVVCKGLTALIKAQTVPLRRVSIALNNEVVAERDMSTGAVEGVVAPRIVDVQPTIEAEFRLPAQSTLNPFTEFTSENAIAVAITLGDDAGNICGLTTSGFQNAPPDLHEVDGLVYVTMRMTMDWDNKLQMQWT